MRIKAHFWHVAGHFGAVPGRPRAGARARRRARQVPVGPDGPVSRTKPRGSLPSRNSWPALPALAARQGKLGDVGRRPARRHDGLGAVEPPRRPPVRLRVAAVDQDTRVARHQQMQQEMSQVYNQFQSAIAFMRPETAGGRPREDRSRTWPPNRGCASTGMYFDDILRAAPHTLSPAEEKVLRPHERARRQAGSTVQSVFRSADLPFPEITLASGREGAPRCVRLREVPRVAGQGGPRRGVRGVLGPLRRIHAHVRDDAERHGRGERRQPRRAQVPDHARRVAVRLQHPAHRSTRSCSPTCTRTCRRCTATCGCGRRSWACRSSATRTSTRRSCRASTCSGRRSRR